MTEEGCTVEGEAARGRRAWARLWEKVRTLREAPEGRRLAVLGIAGLMAAWALILTFLGIVRLPGPIQNPPNPYGNGSSTFLLGGGGVMAAVSLGAWVFVIERAQRRRFALKVVQVAGATVAFATLSWGAIRYAPARVPLLVGIAAFGIGVSWTAHWYEARHPQPTGVASRSPRPARSR